MRTLEITAYTFDELSETAKEVAIYNNRDINTCHNWWEWTYQDAENFGIRIRSFDIYYRNISIEFTLDPLDIANNILNECAPTSDLYSFADVYRSAYNKLDDTGDDTDEKLEELASVFKHALRREYLNILTKELEYLESDEEVIESLMANMYEFTADGNNLKY
jgi:hypothetical protein